MLTALTTCYLALSLGLGVAQQTWLWARGQHATVLQASLHERLEQRGLANHHHVTSGVRVAQSPLEALLPAAQSDLTAAPPLTPNAPLDGTSCAPLVALSMAGPACGPLSLARPMGLRPPEPPAAAPDQPPRAR